VKHWRCCVCMFGGLERSLNGMDAAKLWQHHIHYSKMTV
jgi:hypothetical protein